MAAQVFETTSLPVQICLAGLVVAAAVLLRLAFPEKTAGHDYASQKYWDGRYRHVPEDKHEWYVDVDDALLRRIVAAISAPGKPKVLDIGCGNSTLVQRLSTARWDVTGIDYSPAVINRMQSIHPDYAHKYVVGDCSSMRFKTASFDAAIDKGTIDGILQHADKDPRAKRNARRVLHEVARVLKPSATLVSISINSPEKIRVALCEEGSESADWDVGEAETWAQPNPNSDTPIAVYMHRLKRRKANS